jgi:hypothetical protein
MAKLCVNIDHVATVRQARRAMEPDPIAAAIIAELAGAAGITCHLREDRRHIQDVDVERLKTVVKTHLNLEMAVTDEMLKIAERIKPHMVMFVPENRTEITTEGGLDVAGNLAKVREATRRIQNAGMLVSRSTQYANAVRMFWSYTRARTPTQNSDRRGARNCKNWSPPPFMPKPTGKPSMPGTGSTCRTYSRWQPSLIFASCT